MAAKTKTKRTRKRTRTIDAEDKERLRGIKPTLEELRLIDARRCYELFRKRHFGDRVLEPRRVAFAFVSKECLGRLSGSDLGMAHCHVEGGKSAGAVECATFFMREDLEEGLFRGTLLHEMAHVSVNRRFRRNMGHGTHWQREMRRLAKDGAFDNIW